MKRSICMFLISGMIIIYSGCSEDNVISPVSQPSGLVAASSVNPSDNARKPSSHLTGTMDLNFTGHVGLENPIWIGTINIEGFGEFGMRFFHLSPPKGFSQASPFEEYWEIFDSADPTVVYLGGSDEGVTTLANKPPDPCNYVMNGEVKVANEPFDNWMGRNVHMSGIITFQFITLPDGTVQGPVPATAPGTFQIN